MFIGAEETKAMAMASLAEKMQVEFTDLRCEGVGVARDVLALMVVAPDQAVVGRQGGTIAAPLEVIAVRQAGQRHAALGDTHLCSKGNKRADYAIAALLMTAEDCKGVVVAGFADALALCIEIANFHWCSLRNRG